MSWRAMHWAMEQLDEVGDLFRISVNQVVAMARRGEIPYLTIAGKMRFSADDIEDWLRYQRNDTPVLPPKMRDVTPSERNP